MEQLASLATKRTFLKLNLKKYKDENEIFIKISSYRKPVVDKDTKVNNIIKNQNTPKEPEILTNIEDENELKNQPGLYHHLWLELYIFHQNQEQFLL